MTVLPGTKYYLERAASYVDGGLAIAGCRTVGNGGCHAVVVGRWDASGTVVFEHEAGSGANADGLAVDTNGDIVLSGTFDGGIDLGGGSLSGGIFLAKLDGTGKHVWSKGLQVSIPGTVVNRIAGIDGQGVIYLAGYFPGSIDFGTGKMVNDAGMTEVYLARFQSDGSVIDVRTFGNGGGQEAAGAAVGKDGSVVLVGKLAGADFGSGPLPGENNGNTIHVLRLLPSGTVDWVKTLASTEPVVVWEMALLPTGDAVVTGAFNGTLSVEGIPVGTVGSGLKAGLFLVDLGPDGQLHWAKSVGDGFVGGYSVTGDAAGNVIVTGAGNGVVDFGGGAIVNNDVTVVEFGMDGTNGVGFVAKLDRCGNHLWSRPYGRDAMAIARVSGSRILVGGHTWKGVEFGSNASVPPSGDGEPEIFVAALAY
jgi:hypothetical protein